MAHNLNRLSSTVSVSCSGPVVSASSSDSSELEKLVPKKLCPSTNSNEARVPIDSPSAQFHPRAAHVSLRGQAPIPWASQAVPLQLACGSNIWLSGWMDLIGWLDMARHYSCSMLIISLSLAYLPAVKCDQWINEAWPRHQNMLNNSWILLTYLWPHRQAAQSRTPDLGSRGPQFHGSKSRNSMEKKAC
jgi:hypothetical protein